MWKAIWKDPVWSKVIATVIVTAGGAAVTYFFNLWPTIGHYVAGLARSATEPNQLPNWLFWLITVLAFPTVLFVFVILWIAVRPTKETEANDWRSYTDDKFVGLRWRWKYYSDGSLGDVLSFCPYCDFQVIPKDAGYGAADCIAFHCDGCGRDLPTFEESYGSLESKVRRLIQQKLRNNAWPRRSGT